MAEKDPKDPSTTSTAYDAMAPSWQKINTVLAGTEAMRRSPEYLPQHEEEGDTAYQERLTRGTLDNLSSQVLKNWVGKPFSKPILRSKGMNSQVAALLENVDLMGNSVDVFARSWFRGGLAKAFDCVLVEYPRLTQPEGRTRTRADDIKEQLRPYWIHVNPEDVVFTAWELVGSRLKLKHLRIQMIFTEQKGFAEVYKHQIKVYDRIGDVVTMSTYEKVKDPRTRKEAWKKVGVDQVLGIKEIPLVVFYSDEPQAPMLAKSPLEDIVDLNVALWQSSTDQLSCLTVARFPILALSGGTDEENKLRIGPHQWLWVPEPSGRFYYVEHSGAALGAGREYELDLKEEIANYGLEFTKKRPDRETATARALQTEESTSPLQDSVLRFNDALNQALIYTGMWMGIAEPGTLIVSREFGPSQAESRDLDALRDARKGRDISRKKYLTALHQRSVLPFDFNFDENETELASEKDFEAESKTKASPPAVGVTPAVVAAGG